jgi:hypothetical protein
LFILNFLSISLLFFSVHAPPGGHSSNIFGTEFEQSAANKKKHMESDIFGSKKDNVDPVPVK